jgi:hypothetical protein
MGKAAGAEVTGQSRSASSPFATGKVFLGKIQLAVLSALDDTGIPQYQQSGGFILSPPEYSLRHTLRFKPEFINRPGILSIDCLTLPESTYYGGDGKPQHYLG